MRGRPRYLSKAEYLKRMGRLGVDRATALRWYREYRWRSRRREDARQAGSPAWMEH